MAPSPTDRGLWDHITGSVGARTRPRTAARDRHDAAPTGTSPKRTTRARRTTCTCAVTPAPPAAASRTTGARHEEPDRRGWPRAPSVPTPPPADCDPHPCTSLLRSGSSRSCGRSPCRRLHERVADRRADEAEAAALQLLASSRRDSGVSRRDLARSSASGSRWARRRRTTRGTRRAASRPAHPRTRARSRSSTRPSGGCGRLPGSASSRSTRGVEARDLRRRRSRRTRAR